MLTYPITVAIPTEVVTYLDILRLASQVMFGLFLTGLVLAVITLLLLPLPICLRSGWLQFLGTLLSLLTMLCTTIATIIASAIFLVLRHVATQFQELNIGAEIGTKMFVFMWIAAACTIIAWLMETSICCCCRKRRRREHSRNHAV